MPSTSPGYSITVRVEVPQRMGATAELAAAVQPPAASLTALDVVESGRDGLVVDVTCDSRRRRPRRPDPRRHRRAGRGDRP